MGLNDNLHALNVEDSSTLLEYVSRLSLQWLAGFFDGEGCVSVSIESSNGNTHLVVVLPQKNPAPLVVISLKFPAKLKCHSKDKTHFIRWFGKDALPILEFIKDYVFVKKREVELGIEFISLIGQKKVMVSDENHKRRCEIMAELKKLNQDT